MSLNFPSVIGSGKHLLSQAQTLLHSWSFLALKRYLSKVDKPNCSLQYAYEMSKVSNYSFVLGHFSTDEYYRTGVGWEPSFRIPK